MADDISWQAPEFEYIEKGPDWYWAVGVIATTLIVAAILFENLLFSLVILFATIALVTQANREPDILEFTIDRRGVRIENTLYPYASLRSFWVENTEHEQQIILQSQKNLMPYIIVPIAEVDPEEVRDYLLQFLPEEEHEEPLSHKIMEYLGF